MDDLISRQEAIDAIDGEITITGRANATAVKGYVNLVKDRLERLPSALPEIIVCEDCKWRISENRKTTSLWLPCRALVTPDQFSCIYAERREVTT